MNACFDRYAGASLFALASAMAGCTSTGTAVGELKEPTGKEDPVTLVWKSEAMDPDRGAISGKLPNGIHYAGKYFEVVKAASADVYDPAWEGWDPYWSEWTPAWYGSRVDDIDWPGFVTLYTGRVIANLKSDDDKSRLRCRFTLAAPREGLKGGGSGDCQLSSGGVIQDVVLQNTRG